MKKICFIVILVSLMLVSCKPEPEMATVITKEVTSITSVSAKVIGSVTDDGGVDVISRGVCWSTNVDPTIDNAMSMGASSGIGNFECEIKGLEPNTTYYVKAYATNSVGLSYGEQKEFVTQEKEYLIEVITNEISNVTQTTAQCGGNIKYEGEETIEARGVCWSTSPEPTIDDFCTVDGSGVGGFISNMTGLTDNTLYYVKAYAKVNDVVIYGEQKTFTTVKDIYAPDGNIGGYEYVDLGLPSGLKWATHNVGANAPEKYGNYFSWGEISPKNEYNTSSTMGVQMTDFSGNPQYDAATSNWGDTWRMPTKAEMEELMTLCEWNSVQKDGVVGVKVTGPNGNCLFLPAAGHAYGPWIYFVDYGCYYWSSSPYDSSENIFAYFLSYDVYTGFYEGMAHSERLYGLPIRPVSE